MAGKYINPFTDFGFKRLFGEEVNKDLLIDFLNGLLPEHHKIKELSYNRNEHLGDLSMDRKAVFDIYCQSQNGDKFIVELQKAKQNFFKDRSVFYATFPIREQADRGEWNFELSAVYCVGILDFVFEEDADNPDYLHTVQLKNRHNQVFFDKLTFIYIEMPKFEKTEQQLDTQFDRWLYFIKNLENFNHIPQRLQSRLFEKAFQIAEIAKFDPSQRNAYESSLKYYRDIKNVVDTSFEEGKMEGLEEGIQKGLEEGIKKGRLELVLQMLQLGLPIYQIAQISGLSENEINRFRPND
jgi:predicted transposase/invertase (TIGR01784 family)